MFECPHCSSRGISAWGKYWSGSASPAYCKVCNKPSALRSIEYIKSNLIIFAIALASFYLMVNHTVFWVLSIVFSYFIGRLYFLFASKLHQMADDQVVESKKYGNLFLVVIIGLIVAAYFIR